MDIIYLHGLKVECTIGVWEWERRIRQAVIVDVDMGFDTGAAATSDAVEDTLDYKAVAKRLISFGEESSFRLVESMAHAIANILRQEFGVAWCRVRVNKPGALRGARDVGVIIERGERG